MEPSKEFIDQLRLEEIERARAMTVRQKFSAGAELFDFACSASIGMIRRENPGISDHQVIDIIRKRLQLAKRSEARP